MMSKSKSKKNPTNITVSPGLVRRAIEKLHRGKGHRYNVNMSFPEEGVASYRVCMKSTVKGAKGEHCLYCGNVLNCDGCNGKVECLGAPYLNFCSNRCAEDWRDLEQAKRKLRNFFWKHPFKLIAIIGALISLTSAFVMVLNNFSPIQSLCITGILIVALAGILGVICQAGDRS